MYVYNFQTISIGGGGGHGMCKVENS